jgi:N-acetylglucosaminyldiphosphoundecaprenol N-acetyl-beta-D-mannosaminyltransferase
MRIELLGCPIDAISMDETISRIEEAIRSKRQIHHVVVNVAKLVNMQKNAELRASVIGCDIINADGQGVVWAAKLLGENIPERVAGIDLMTRMIDVAACKRYKVYFLGAKEEIVSSVVKKVSDQYGNEMIAGYRNGYFSVEDELDVADGIASSNANILFVAISSPKKEIFLYRNKEKLKDVNLIMGVGGSFDVLAGKVKRAPVWMQNAGLEWFYRLLQEPRRMFYRYFSTNLQLIYLLIKEKIFQIV